MTREPEPRFLIDSMIVDQLVATDELRDRVHELTTAGRVDIVRTHLQTDENASTPDPAKRERLLGLELPEIPTSVFVLDYSRLDHAALGDGEAYEELRQDNAKHTEDAILGATAEAAGRVLVTEDRTLRARASVRGVTVWSGAELVSYLAAL